MINTRYLSGDRLTPRALGTESDRYQISFKRFSTRQEIWQCWGDRVTCVYVNPKLDRYWLIDYRI